MNSEHQNNIEYSESFIEKALKIAEKKGCQKARWVLVQYDFAYEPQLVKREISDDPTFLGILEYENMTSK